MRRNGDYDPVTTELHVCAAERSIDTIIYTLKPALPANRKPIGFNP